MHAYKKEPQSQLVCIVYSVHGYLLCAPDLYGQVCCAGTINKRSATAGQRSASGNIYTPYSILTL